MINKANLLESLIPVAREAGEATMVYYGDTTHQTKGDGSPVTLADEAAERLILPALKRLTPDIVIISEENSASHALRAPDRFWLVDPLDGTKEFLKADGEGSFTVNIALVDQGQPVLGVVFAPALDRLFLGAQGVGAEEIADGKRKSIAAGDYGARETIAVASASHLDAETEAWLDAQGIVRKTSIGSSLKFCLVASGEADVYPRFGPTMEWDTAAGDAVLRAAGGSVTTPAGELFTYGKPDYRNGSFIAWGRRPA